MTQKQDNGAIIAITRDLLAFSENQNAELRAKSQPLALMIAQSKDPVQAMRDVFAVVRGEYLVAKKIGKTQATNKGTAWNRIKTNIRYHLGEAHGLVPHFPDLRSGEGECVLRTKQEESDARKFAKDEADKRDAEAVAAYQAKQAESEIEALRSNTVDEMVAQINEMLLVWDGDVSAVLIALTIQRTESEPAKPRRRPGGSPRSQ